MKKKNVILTGWSQIKEKVCCDYNQITPITLMQKASIEASFKSNINNVLDKVDGIMVIRPLSFFYDSPAKILANQLGITPSFLYTSGIGGHSPQLLINMAAEMILLGKLDIVLITGAEAFYSKKKKKEILKTLSENYSGEDIIGSTRLESDYDISMPLDGFPLIETAFWGHSKLTIKNYLSKIGKLGSEFSRIASKNKTAWIDNYRSIDEIIIPSNDNRKIAFPYTKFMCPILSVNMGSAIILSSNYVTNKPKFGKNTVYFVGGAYAQDRQQFLIQRKDLTSSFPLKRAVDKALKRSSVSLENIQCFDLYSCFPSSVFIAKKMIGLSESDMRPMTITGGLPYYGGPGSNYGLHSISTLADLISEGSFNSGMITTLGWFMHKHAVGIYKNAPSNSENIKNSYTKDSKNCLVGDPPLKTVNLFKGTAHIETYTVHYYKENGQKAVIYAITSTGERLIGFIKNTDMLNEIILNNYIGKKVTVSNDQGKNIITLE